MTKSIPTLRQLFELAQTNAKRVFAEDGSIVPIWHAVPENADADQLLICSPWCNDDEKDMAVEAIRDMFKLHRVQRYVFVVEAWTVTGTSLKVVNEARPSEHPDRREVVRITAEDRDGSVLSGQYYILRPEHGPVTLSPFHEDPADMSMSLGGRMHGLLAGTRH